MNYLGNKFRCAVLETEQNDRKISNYQVADSKTLP